VRTAAGPSRAAPNAHAPAASTRWTFTATSFTSEDWVAKTVFASWTGRRAGTGRDRWSRGAGAPDVATPSAWSVSPGTHQGAHQVCRTPALRPGVRVGRSCWGRTSAPILGRPPQRHIDGKGKPSSLILGRAPWDCPATGGAGEKRGARPANWCPATGTPPVRRRDSRRRLAGRESEPVGWGLARKTRSPSRWPHFQPRPGCGAVADSNEGANP